MALRPPKIAWDSSGKCYVVFYLNRKRYRLSNGSRMGINLNPNRHEVGERKALAEELRLKIHLKLIEGWKDGKIDMDAYNADLAQSIVTEVVVWDSSIERLTYFIDANDNKIANVNMLWDNVIVSFEVDTMHEEFLKKFAKTLE